MALESFDPSAIIGLILFLIGVVIAAWKGYQARGLSGAIDAIKDAMSDNTNTVTVPDVLKDTPSIYTMAERTKQIILDGLPDLEKVKIENVIAEKESLSILWYELYTSKGTYEIANGDIRNVKALEIQSTDPGSGEIFRVWGGTGGQTAGNVPKYQPAELEMEMSARTLFVSIKPTEAGTVTLGLWNDGKLFRKILYQFSANDMDKDTEIAFPTNAIEVPKEIIQEARGTDNQFDLVVAVARGSKWYFLENFDDVAPWETPVSLKVNCPALEKDQ